MPRSILGETQVHAAVRAKVAGYHADIAKARKLLDDGASDLKRLLESGQL
jgi:hypothetical protein